MCKACIGHREPEANLMRRQFLSAGVSAMLVASGFGLAVAANPKSTGAPLPNAIAPAEALKRLMDGNARYAANTPNERDFSAGRAARAQAQFPIAAILSCADSRVAPELAFDQGPGDLFVVRVAGNVVSPSLLASLEYGVQFLGVPLIMVLGHSACGAVDAAVKVYKDKAVLPGHLPELINAIVPAVAAAAKVRTGNLLDNSVAENVRRQVNRLRSSQPIVQKSYADKRIDIVGGIYDLSTGRIAMA